MFMMIGKDDKAKFIIFIGKLICKLNPIIIKKERKIQIVQINNKFANNKQQMMIAIQSSKLIHNQHGNVHLDNITQIQYRKCIIII